MLGMSHPGRKLWKADCLSYYPKPPGISIDRAAAPEGPGFSRLDFLARDGYTREMKKPAALPGSLFSVAEQVGDAVSHSGFDPLVGRIWTVLFLTPGPLDAKAIAKALKSPEKKIDAALVEMERWGSVVRHHHAAMPQYTAELNAIKILVRVLREREMPGLEELSARLKRAQDDRALEPFARDRLHLLGEILRVSKLIIEIVLMVAQLDSPALSRARDTIAALSSGLGGVLGRLTKFRN